MQKKSAYLLLNDLELTKERGKAREKKTETGRKSKPQKRR